MATIRNVMAASPNIHFTIHLTTTLINIAILTITTKSTIISATGTPIQAGMEPAKATSGRFKDCEMWHWAHLVSFALPSTPCRRRPTLPWPLAFPSRIKGTSMTRHQRMPSQGRSPSEEPHRSFGQNLTTTRAV
mmetsp:Transcript_2699/g.6343  ORF Transcript_2699/g.6343 Transcript_2699/m.6343 type:complete len:134 (+) Transcript_2699:153-554(+)